MIKDIFPLKLHFNEYIFTFPTYEKLIEDSNVFNFIGANQIKLITANPIILQYVEIRKVKNTCTS